MKNVVILFFAFLTTQVWAENAPKQVEGKDKQFGKYKYQIVVENQPQASVVMCNGQIDLIQNSATRGWSDLGVAISTAYKSSVTQKTVNATSNLLSLGINYVSTYVQKPKKDFESWSKAKQQQCTFKKDLSSQETIDDFYYRPSVNGALDPRDLKFNGFVCRNFFEPQSVPKDTNKRDVRVGHDVFYVSCKLRTDSLGLSHLTNHSKFLLEIDSLVFNPQRCNIPNNNSVGIKNVFNFDECTDLEFEMKVKVLSSWVNEAIMFTNDYQLGEFIIRARIDESALTTVGKDTLFIYDKNNPKMDSLVSIIGESFIVPRSFVGTANEPVWGTGQYKLAIEISQTCQLNARYYLKDEYIRIDEVGNGRVINFANLPAYKEWNKAVWKEEWRTMKHRKQSNSFMTNVWEEIKTAYIGSNWVKELTDPAVTQILDYEFKELNGLLNWDADGQSQGIKNNTSKNGNTNMASGLSQSVSSPNNKEILPLK